MITEPICGREWLRQHQYQYSQAEIDALGIELKVNGKKLPAISQDKKDRGLVKDLVKSYRKE